MTDRTTALETALAAILCEARGLGVDIEAVCAAAKRGLIDGGKQYRWAGPAVVVPAAEAIDVALEVARGPR